MTISTTTAKSRYAGDGTTTSFPTGFKFLDNDHVRVVLRSAVGGETLWTEGSEYALSGAGAPGGGTVTVNTSPTDYTPAAGETLVVKLAVPARQETSLPLGGAFPSTAVEGMADLAALRDQQVEESLSRALKFKESTALADVEFPEPEAGKILGVKPSGTELEWQIPQEAAVPSGGTTGQALRKASDESYDAEWFTLGALAVVNTIAAAQIDDDAVGNAKLSNMAEATLKGRAAGASAGDPQDLTAAQLRTILQTVDGAGSGLDADLLDGLEAAAFELSGNKGVANGYAALDGGGKVPTVQLPDAVLGALQYQGAWNAATNAPALSGSGGGGSQGHYYRVSAAGTTSLDGVSQWSVGDYVVNNGAAWEKIDNTDQVVSVHGRQGAVVANSGDYNAGQITNTPFGGVSATTLQAAINELDSEKLSAGHAGSGGSAHSNVVASGAAGFMTGSDKAKLDSIAAGADANPAVAGQVQAEDGANTTQYTWTPQRVHQAAKDAVPITLIVAVGDESTALTTGIGKVTFRLPHAMTLSGVRASLTTASSSGVVSIDINEGGLSVLSTVITIDANEKTSTTAATAAVISDNSLADDAEITIDIDAAGTNATGLKIALIGYKTAT
ncbi:hypothetical protein AAFN88_12860 [Pelagibius sp. CAU 1746]|uniref:hypothetical protein n=1 Tax=Pelagibius sp. CAU 1746 TaxID=3140370 RepID=UPI00325BEE6E